MFSNIVFWFLEEKKMFNNQKIKNGFLFLKRENNTFFKSIF